MTKSIKTDVSYFPGCSLETTAQENNQSLINVAGRLGYNMVALEDWNCCGSSSAHSLDADLAFKLATRNIALAPPDRPLVASCPNCTLRLRETLHKLQTDAKAREAYERLWDKPFDPKFEFLHFFDWLDSINLRRHFRGLQSTLAGLSFVVYYGCMLKRPPALNRGKNYYGFMEKLLADLGATPLQWSYGTKCCGTFLSVSHPEDISQIVDRIVQGAADAKADCIVTACAMCHMNLEVRCRLKKPVPTLHFTELLAMAMGEKGYNEWFARHLVDPRPMLKSKNLIQ